MNRKFLLCYHDFSVSNASRAAEQIRALSSLAKAPITVAVIPLTEGASPCDVERFLTELERLNSEGFELLLHGFRHRASPEIRPNIWGKFALRLTGHEAEFAGLSASDAWTLLLRAEASWKNFGVGNPKGFVPPAWYGSGALKRLVSESGLEFYEDRFAIYRKDSAEKFRRIFSPALSFAGLPTKTLSTAVALSRLALRMPFAAPRLVFHPVDFVTLGWPTIERLVCEALALRDVSLYGELG